MFFENRISQCRSIIIYRKIRVNMKISGKNHSKRVKSDGICKSFFEGVIKEQQKSYIVEKIFTHLGCPDLFD